MSQASGFAPTAATAVPASIADSVGQPDPEQIAYAAQIRQSIPADLYDAAHSPELAWMLTLALGVDREPAHAERQLHFITEQVGEQRGEIVRRLAAQLAEVGGEYRLPLLEIAFPALKLRPEQQREFFLELVKRLIELDGVIDLYE